MTHDDHKRTSAALGVLSAPAFYQLRYGAPPASDPGSVIVLAAIMGVVGWILGPLPDLDQPGSRISRKLGFTLPGGHRTWTHAIWVPLVLVLAGWGMATPIAIACWAVASALVSHDLMDWLSYGGVCLLWPLTRYLDEENPTGPLYEAHVAPGYHRPKLYYTGDAREYDSHGRRVPMREWTLVSLVCAASATLALAWVMVP